MGGVSESYSALVSVVEKGVWNKSTPMSSLMVESFTSQDEIPFSPDPGIIKCQSFGNLCIWHKE